MKVTTKIEGLGDLSKAFQLLKGATDTVLEPAARAGAEVVRQAANQDAPGPHNEINMKRVSQKKAEAEIGPDKEHWYYLFEETGTDAHEITPSKKKALTWPGGPMVKRVSHPGRAARPFLRPALDNNLNKILNAMSNVLRQVIR